MVTFSSCASLYESARSEVVGNRISESEGSPGPGTPRQTASRDEDKVVVAVAVVVVVVVPYIPEGEEE